MVDVERNFGQVDSYHFVVAGTDSSQIVSGMLDAVALALELSVPDGVYGRQRFVEKRN